MYPRITQGLESFRVWDFLVPTGGPTRFAALFLSLYCPIGIVTNLLLSIRASMDCPCIADAI